MDTQSVGVGSGARATRLILSGKTLTGLWKILDDTQDSLTTVNNNTGFYRAAKPRVDRVVQSKEIVTEIRVSAVARVLLQTGNTIFPQVQVFAGEPAIKDIMSSNNQNGISVSSSTTDGYKVFDKIVKDTGITPIGPAQFYLRGGQVRQNIVADSGVIHDLVATNFESVAWLALSFPAKRLIGYLYSIDKVIGEGGDFEAHSYAGTISFEGRQTNDPSANTNGSVAGGWQSLGLISLDKCVGKTFNVGQGQLTAWLAANQASLNTWTATVLGLSGADRDKAYLVDEVNLRAIRFLNSLGTWHDEGAQLESSLDAMHDVENTTHYDDIAQSNTSFEQFRFVVRSVMNTIKPTNSSPRVQMPEMQFFELPDNPINVGNVASVAFLKAIDSNGALHDILGRHMRLPRRQTTNPAFRLYIGGVQNAENTLYFALQGASGLSVYPRPIGTGTTNVGGRWLWDIAVANSSPTYYKIYIKDTNGDEIILSSGYTGV